MESPPQALIYSHQAWKPTTVPGFCPERLRIDAFPSPWAKGQRTQQPHAAWWCGCLALTSGCVSAPPSAWQPALAQDPSSLAWSMTQPCLGDSGSVSAGDFPACICSGSQARFSFLLILSHHAESLGSTPIHSWPAEPKIVRQSGKPGQAISSAQGHLIQGPLGGSWDASTVHPATMLCPLRGGTFFFKLGCRW